MENIIFYFSATGNSLQVAKDLAEGIGSCEVCDLARTDLSNEFAQERIGFVYPIYFLGLPHIVEKFIKNIKIGKESYLFAVETYGNFPGKTLNQAENLLKQRGLTLNSGFTVRMPDNYIVGYNARSDKFQKKCFTKEKSKVDEICKTVLAMESKPLEKSKFIIDRFLTEPIHRASDKKYKAVDYGFEAGQNCIGCGLCERICPADNIKLIDKKPQWNHHCEYCLACIQRCPVQAINHNNKTQGRKRYLNPNVRFPNKTGRQNTSA